MLNAKENKIHQELLRACAQFKSSTESIVVILLYVSKTKLYRKLKRRNLVEYIIEELKIDSTFTFDLNRVVRAAIEVPELEAALRSRRLTVSKATRILSALKPENAKTLIGYAATHTYAEINAFVAEGCPAEKFRETWKQLSADQFKVSVVLTAEQFKNLRRVQSLEAQMQKAAKMADAFGAALDTYVNRFDPHKRAERSQARKAKRVTLKEQMVSTDDSIRTRDLGEVTSIQFNGESKSEGMEPISSEMESVEQNLENRVSQPQPLKIESDERFIKFSPDGWVTISDDEQTPNFDSTMSSDLQFGPKPVVQTTKQHGRIRLTAAEIHAVFLQTGGQCCFRDRNNKRCENDRWLEIHHKIPVSQGGTNAIENLIHLCGPHHDIVHQEVLPLDDQEVWWSLDP